jgi:hypothetical protein
MNAHACFMLVIHLADRLCYWPMFEHMRQKDEPLKEYRRHDRSSQPIRYTEDVFKKTELDNLQWWVRDRFHIEIRPGSTYFHGATRSVWYCSGHEALRNIYYSTGDTALLYSLYIVLDHLVREKYNRFPAVARIDPDRHIRWKSDVKIKPNEP